MRLHPITNSSSVAKVSIGKISSSDMKMNRQQVETFIANPSTKNIARVEDILELPNRLFESWNANRKICTVEDVYTTAIAFNNKDVLLKVLDVVKECAGKFGDIPFMNMVANCVAFYGRREIVDEMIKRGADDWNNMARGAAEGGHKELLDDMIIEQGANNWSMIAEGAARGDHKEIVDDMFERGVLYPNSVIGYAAQGGNKELLTYLIDKYGDGNEGKDIAYGATEGGHLDILKNYLDLKQLDYDQLILNAIDCGHMEIALYIEKNRGCSYIVDDCLRK